jgi:hypothetical protein
MDVPGGSGWNRNGATDSDARHCSHPTAPLLILIASHIGIDVL